MGQEFKEEEFQEEEFQEEESQEFQEFQEFQNYDEILEYIEDSRQYMDKSMEFQQWNIGILSSILAFLILIFLCILVYKGDSL